MISPNQQRARRQYRTTEVRGDANGTVCRVSRCLPGAPIVVLFQSIEAAERVAALGKKCSEWGCRMLHTTEELEIEDVAPWQK